VTNCCSAVVAQEQGDRRPGRRSARSVGADGTRDSRACYRVKWHGALRQYRPGQQSLPTCYGGRLRNVCSEHAKLVTRRPPPGSLAWQRRSTIRPPRLSPKCLYRAAANIGSCNGPQPGRCCPDTIPAMKNGLNLPVFPCEHDPGMPLDRDPAAGGQGAGARRAAAVPVRRDGGRVDAVRSPSISAPLLRSRTRALPRRRSAPRSTRAARLS
jgi:hypothetical protein